MSFLFGSSVVVPLAETAGLNTRRFRQARAAEVARLTTLAFNFIKTDLTAFSAAHVETTNSYVFTEEPLQKAASGLNKASEEERNLVIDGVSKLVLAEKFEVETIPAGLKISWVVAPEPVVAAPPAPATPLVTAATVVEGQVTEVELK